MRIIIYIYDDDKVDQMQDLLNNQNYIICSYMDNNIYKYLYTIIYNNIY